MKRQSTHLVGVRVGVVEVRVVVVVVVVEDSDGYFTTYHQSYPT